MAKKHGGLIGSLGPCAVVSDDTMKVYIHVDNTTHEYKLSDQWPSEAEYVGERMVDKEDAQ